MISILSTFDKKDTESLSQYNPKALKKELYNIFLHIYNEDAKPNNEF